MYIKKYWQYQLEALFMEVIVQAPGRINLIGEHTDYNEGFVLPAAIDLKLTLKYKKNYSESVNIRAHEYKDFRRFSIKDIYLENDPLAWDNYIKAVYQVFSDSGFRIEGADLEIKSTIPVGSGLSSSAALELALASALAKAVNLSLSLPELAAICQKAENDYIGVQSGIMDQYAIALGRKDYALFLDCRTLNYNYVPVYCEKHAFLIVDSKVERKLAESDYNQRRKECSEAVKRIACLNGNPLQSLRDLNLSELNKYASYLPYPLFNRARYILEENERVLIAREALSDRDLKSFGELMKASHAGLRNLYEVSCPELDTIVDTAIAIPGVLGARMTGAGFGGCAIILLKKGVLEELKDKLLWIFKDRGWMEPEFYETGIAEGLKIIKCNKKQ